MPLEIHPLTPDDLEAWVRVHYLAFHNTPVSCMWLGEPTPASFSTTAKSRGSELLSGNPTAYYYKVIDTDLPQAFNPGEWTNQPGKCATGNIVSVAKWHIYESERSEAEVKGEFTLPAPFEEECRLARDKFMVGIYDSRWELMGTKPHVILESLVTHPDHHRRGAGGMLVKWGNQRADELGLVSYLEGSRDGRALYERYGFNEVRGIRCDLREFGGEVDVHTVS